MRVATEKQILFVEDLIKTREVNAGILAFYTKNKDVLTAKQASDLIDTLLRMPKIAPKFDFEKMSVLAREVNEALTSVPKSKYAIPVTEVMTDLLLDKVHGDLIFLEVKEWRGRLVISKLFGSVGAFTRVRPKSEDALTFLRIIQQDPTKYARIFGEHYKCCGKCGAELTDPESRRLQFGPDCRRAFGL